MADVIKFDNSIEYKLQRAENLSQDAQYNLALPLCFEVLQEDEKNERALLLIGKMYAEMNAFPESTEAYMNLLAFSKNPNAVKGIIANLLVQGEFINAKYYARTYNVDFDFSDFLTVQTEDGETILGDEDEENDDVVRDFHLIVNRSEKGGENKALQEKPLKDMTVGDLSNFVTADGFFKLNELMEKLMDMADDEEEEEKPEKRRTEIGFKQVYPIPNKECESIIDDAFKTFTAGKVESALEKLSKITKKCGKYYYIAEKNKVLCYLSLNRMASMRASAEIALKGLPDDFALKCYYYISLKLLEENKEADKIYEEIKNTKATSSMEYMVKLDACRLQCDHEGIIDAVEHILPDFPYQHQLLLLYAKALYNAGQIDASRASFIEILHYYPDEFEASMMLDKINTKDDGEMSYSEIEMQIMRVKILGDIKIYLQNSGEFLNYIKTDKNAIKNLEFVLLNESNKSVFSLMLALKNYMTADIQKLMRRILLSPKASVYLKTLIISTLIGTCYPKVVAVSQGNKLKIVDMPDYSWDKGMTDVFIEAANLTFAQFIMAENNPQKRIIALGNRLFRVSEFLNKEGDLEIKKEVENMTDVVALKRALYDMTEHKISHARPMTVSDENYNKYINILERIDEDYEI